MVAPCSRIRLGFTKKFFARVVEKNRDGRLDLLKGIYIYVQGCVSRYEVAE